MSSLPQLWTSWQKETPYFIAIYLAMFVMIPNVISPLFFKGLPLSTYLIQDVQDLPTPNGELSVVPGDILQLQSADELVSVMSRAVAQVVL